MDKLNFWSQRIKFCVPEIFSCHCNFNKQNDLFISICDTWLKRFLQSSAQPKIYYSYGIRGCFEQLKLWANIYLRPKINLKKEGYYWPLFIPSTAETKPTENSVWRFTKMGQNVLTSQKSYNIFTSSLRATTKTLRKWKFWIGNHAGLRGA